MATSNRAKGILLILFSALMFGSYGVWSRLIGSSFGVFYQAWTKCLIISVVLLPILYFKKQIVPIKRKDWKWMTVYLIFTSFTLAPLFYAFNHLDIGTATLLFFVSMLITMYSVGFIFLGEKLNTIKLVSFIIAVIGLFTIFSLSLKTFTLFAIFMAILNGVASGGEVSFSKKLSGNYSVTYLMWLCWVTSFFVHIIISLAIGEVQYLPSLNIVWLWQSGFIIASMLGFYAIMEGLKYLEASVGGLLGLLEIVFSITLGIIIFREHLTLKILIGAILIIFAAALPHLKLTPKEG